MNGAPNTSKKVLHLKDENESDMIANFNKADVELSGLGLSNDQKFHIYRVVALVYHLANIHFEDIEEEEGCKLTPSSSKFFKAAALIIGIQEDDLDTFFTTLNLQISAADAIKFVCI